MNRALTVLDRTECIRHLLEHTNLPVLFSH